MNYYIFLRNWYRIDENGKKIPDPGAEKEIIYDDIDTAQECREICQRINDEIGENLLSRKAEFSSY